MTPEQQRLVENRRSWIAWGPYLSERQWGTVREDYSDDGNAWSHFTHDDARRRARHAEAASLMAQCPGTVQISGMAGIGPAVNDAAPFGDGNGDSITDASQANCDGGSSCRWRNTDKCSSEELQWAQGSGSADAQRWQMATGVSQQPCK